MVVARRKKNNKERKSTPRTLERTAGAGRGSKRSKRIFAALGTKANMASSMFNTISNATALRMISETEIEYKDKNMQPRTNKKPEETTRMTSTIDAQAFRPLCMLKSCNGASPPSALNCVIPPGNALRTRTKSHARMNSWTTVKPQSKMAILTKLGPLKKGLRPRYSWICAMTELVPLDISDTYLSGSQMRCVSDVKVRGS
mmetsp:Transcript_30527/g.87194  ORF Transcript_30527/g.87194 Transcript_30527/m.87194 type:complete len:201 (+) Transcript_30527:1097-1699(+)